METCVSPATVSRVLRRASIYRIKGINPAGPAARYEYVEPRGLIHLDIKRLGRFERVGNRIAFTDIFADAKNASAIAFLKAAFAYYEGLGVTVTR